MPRRHPPSPSRGAFVLLVAGVCAPGAAGQVPPDTIHATISGTVLDRGTGVPVSGALVRLVDTPFQARTGADGRYRLGAVPAGPYQLEVDAAGFRVVRGDIRIFRSGELDLPLDPLSGAERSPEQAARIVGRVMEMETGSGLEGAEVSLVGAAASRISDGRGRFEFGDVAPGALDLLVRFLGRAPLEATVEVPSGGTLEVEIRLAVEPVEMEPMVVTATPRNVYLESMGFYQRRDEGRSGFLVSRKELTERNPRSLGDILATVPGLRVLPSNLGGFQVRMRRAVRLSGDGGEGCIPAVFIDDIRSDTGWLQDLDPSRVEAMEIYSGANAPLRYNDSCGVILVWTRRGERG